jgi:Icc-related predicted phosphoesterase
LDFDLITIKGISILGINRWPEYFDIYFDFIPHLGKGVIEQYKGKVDILVTHWPPYGILDKVFKRERGGSKGVLKFVKEIKPKIHIFGHIHEGYGYTEIDGIKFYNVSYLDRQYKTKNKPFLISFPISETEK